MAPVLLRGGPAWGTALLVRPPWGSHRIHRPASSAAAAAPAPRAPLERSPAPALRLLPSRPPDRDRRRPPAAMGFWLGTVVFLVLEALGFSAVQFSSRPQSTKL